MSIMSSKRHALLLCSAASIALATTGFANAAEAANFDIAPQPLSTALAQFGVQSEQGVFADSALTGAKLTKGVRGDKPTEVALNELLAGTGLGWKREGQAFVIVRAAQDPQSGSAAGGGAEVEALIVTAQKREEDIQDVPIAISAFSQEDLTRSQVAGGPDLITQVPNMTFTKTNFSSYSIQIRGIGTQAISATTDPAVAVAFNNTPFIRNRFFEQEFYDLQRVEVLRGPQGTLYGRNATAGVVNIISQKPKFVAEAKLSGDIGNFSSSRLEGMVNIPIVEDTVALRLAGAWTKRDGYATNELNGEPIDGRDLWSTRLSLRVSPNDRIDANLIWEHFEEDDDRLRSGKQLCKKDAVSELAGFEVTDYYMELPAGLGQGGNQSGPQAGFSQGCIRNSLYASNSFQRPNGLMLPYYVPLAQIGLPIALTDPYVTVTDSRDPVVIGSINDQPEDLRVIQSTVDPQYRSKSDLGELQVSFDLTDQLTLSSETAYAVDWVYSLQDFNRFNTAPGAWQSTYSDGRPIDLVERGLMTPDGFFCDPQLGCSDRLVAVDISTAQARQFSQEFRLGSDFEGPFNFSLGGNFLRADSEDKYYVFINSLSIVAAGGKFGMVMPEYTPGVTDNTDCLLNGYAPGNPEGTYAVAQCTYFDPNPIESVNDKGHNYFLSKNPYKLISYAVFGEAYYNVTDALKVTAGLRWTVDKKEAPRVPTWILAALSYGYPVAEVIEQEWREPTGRLTADWKPDLGFTDETLVYASYAHGYKAGGANPPGFVRIFYAAGGKDDSAIDAAKSATRPRTFEPEFLDAFELGMKNTLLDGKATLNLAAFYYDYKGYQLSEIVDRSAFNRNFDAEVWGMELESDWRPAENLRLGLKLGYQKTRIADGQQAIDLMDRTAGDPRWVVARPFPTYASSCILPAWLLVGASTTNPQLVNLGGAAGGSPTGCEFAYALNLDPATYDPYVANPAQSTIAGTHDGVINYTDWSTDPSMYPGINWAGGVVTDRTYPGWDPATAPNGGEGIMKPLGGNELPNAPNWTATITGDYTVPLPNDWLATLHTDLHWQAESWWRVFQDHEYARLDEYFTMNLAAIFTNEERGWNIMAYIKNVTDETAITGAFLNSDDTGLTTNVFLTEPRLYGLRVTKAWTGGPLLGGFGANRDGPFPITVELGGQVQRHEAPNTALHPDSADVFAGPLDIYDEAQGQDLDWGDGRELTVTWRPSAEWSVSAAARSGKTNGLANPGVQRNTPTVCAVLDELQCEFFATEPKYEQFHLHDVSLIDRADARVYDREEHSLIDFAVGREFGFGGLSQSQVSGGVRFAKLKSRTDASVYGIPDWYVPEGFYYLPFVTHTLVNVDTSAERSFEGAGPVVTWDAALPLLNLGETGKVSLDWSLSGGVLFGDQESAISTKVKTRYYEITPTDLLIAYSQTGERTVLPAEIVEDDPAETARTEGATVPLAGASLGVAYRAGAFSVGAGYRWERYFDAIDGGFEEADGVDRTIDGPYFKIAVGFGG
jgi:outer membrane receptor protein involved in Fe transport